MKDSQDRADKNRLGIAVYDFDGTLYGGDSTVDFMLFLLVRRIIILLFLPYQALAVVLWKLGVISISTCKRAFFSAFESLDLGQIDRYVEEFWKRSSGRIFPWVSAALEQDKKEGLFLVCISASPDFLLRTQVVGRLGFDLLICTETAVRKGKLNGLKTPNCKGVEKVRRLYAWAASEEFEITVIKTVSDDDRPLFNISERKLKVVKGEMKEIG